MATYHAPNKKAYNIQKTIDWKYFSYKFISPKYFYSVNDIKTYINTNNPK
jgi:hypothetical protein